MARVITLGHSDRSLDDLIETLQTHDVTRLVDIRRFPGSTAHPHFNQENLETELPQHGIAYEHEPRMGGRRSSPGEGSPNGAWRTPGFQAYADHALTDAFQAALEDLVDAAHEDTVAIMCAEAVPWRCHRRIVADWLTAQGVDVFDAFGPDRAQRHELPEFAEIHDGRVVYPDPDG